MFYIPTEKDNSKTYGKGFQMTFENGNTISVMFGRGNYCSNRGGNIEKDGNWSETAEICIWNESGKDYEFAPGRNVEGWISANDVSKWVQFAAKTNF